MFFLLLLLLLLFLSLISGFVEVKSACCGLGHLHAQIFCLPLEPYCPSRSDHVFWDAHHPTEASARLIADSMFHGSSTYTFPMNVSSLAAV
jgi:phospholipase/lecithinase/hemolysin